MEAEIGELRVTLEGYTLFRRQRLLLNERRRWWPIGERGGSFAVAGELRRFDGASADLLTPPDISSPKGVWSEESRTPPLRLPAVGHHEQPNSKGAVQRPPLLKNECIRTNAILSELRLISLNQIADSEDPSAVLRFRPIKILVADTLLDLDRAGV
jgi:hypothetical protein